MKKRLLIGMICLVGALFLPTELFSQTDLQIHKVFEKYARNKNAVMIELSEDMLESYNLTLYKSIAVKDDAAATDYMRRCLKRDQEGAKKIKQVMKAGELWSAYYQLVKKGSDNRYILFRNDPEAGATLIYIETPVETDNIVNLLLKKQ